MKKDLGKDKSMVVAVGIIAVIVMIIFIYINVFPSEDDSTTVGNSEIVNVKGSSEANFMNLSVPKASVGKDSLSIVDKIEKLKQDSVELLRENSKTKEVLNNPALDDFERTVKKGTPNNRASSGVKNKSYAEYQNEGDSQSEPVARSKPKRKSSSNRGGSSSSTTEEESSFFGNSRASITSSDDTSVGRNAATAAEEDLPTDKKIYACVHNDQTIKDNSRIKIRLTKKTVIDGISYPTNTIIYGLAKLQQNRMFIEITSVNQNRISNLEVFDAEDSNKGIYVETPILNASLKKEVGNEALQEDLQQNIPFSRTLTSFLQKKLKEEKIELLNNYKLIIKKKVE